MIMEAEHILGLRVSGRTDNGCRALGYGLNELPVGRSASVDIVGRKFHLPPSRPPVVGFAGMTAGRECGTERKTRILARHAKTMAGEGEKVLGSCGALDVRIGCRNWC